MFTDMVGSTELISALGDDAWDALRHEHLERLRVLVVRHYGEVIKTMGDGVVAAFGSAASAIAWWWLRKERSVRMWSWRHSPDGRVSCLFSMRPTRRQCRRAPGRWCGRRRPSRASLAKRLPERCQRSMLRS